MSRNSRRQIMTRDERKACDTFMTSKRRELMKDSKKKRRQITGGSGRDDQLQRKINRIVIGNNEELKEPTEDICQAEEPLKSNRGENLFIKLHEKLEKLEGKLEGAKKNLAGDGVIKKYEKSIDSFNIRIGRIDIDDISDRDLLEKELMRLNDKKYELTKIVLYGSTEGNPYEGISEELERIEERRGEIIKRGKSL